jgi:hypothetical protein
MNRILSNSKLLQLAKSIEEVNPERKPSVKTEGDIFEI